MLVKTAVSDESEIHTWLVDIFILLMTMLKYYETVNHYIFTEGIPNQYICICEVKNYGGGESRSTGTNKLRCQSSLKAR